METWVGNSEQSELYTICIEGDYRIRAIAEPPALRVVDSGTVRSDYGGPVVPVSARTRSTVGHLPPTRRIAIFSNDINLTR
jgi:hypothetical protein